MLNEISSSDASVEIYAHSVGFIHGNCADSDHLLTRRKKSLVAIDTPLAITLRYYTKTAGSCSARSHRPTKHRHHTMSSDLRRPRPETTLLRKSTGDASCRTVGTSSMTSCSTQSPGRSERREPMQDNRRQRRQSHEDVSDEDSLQDMLDSMIAESSAKWKSSVQTMQTSTMLQSSWSSLPATEASISRVPSVDDLVRKQQEEIQTLKDALATTAPIAHVSIPAMAPMDHDELTVDL